MCEYCDTELVTDIIVASGNYIRLRLDNVFGDLRIVAHGEYDCVYYPKFCPECGRMIRKGECR